MTKEILSYLLSPVSRASFLDEYYEKKHLLIKDRSADYYNNILTLEDIDDYFHQGHIRPRDVLVTNNHNSTLSKWAQLQDNGQLEVNKESIIKSLYKGDSVVLNFVEEYIPKVNRFAKKLSRDLNCQVKAGIFITPPDAQGFIRHVDYFDIFILQIHGSKKWKLFDGPKELIDHSIVFEDSESFNIEEKEIELKRGDLLYIPRGIGHSAHSTEDVSIHVSFGLFPVRWLDIFRIALDKSFSEGSIRGSFMNWNNTDDNVGKEIEEIKTILNKRIDALSEEEILSIAEELKAKKLNKDYENRLMDYVGHHTINSDSIVSCQDDLILTNDEDGHFCVVQTPKNETFAYPIFAKDTLESILSSKTLKVKDIAGNLDLKNTIKFVKKMIAEGLISIVK